MEHWIDWHLSICNNMVIVKYLSKRLMNDAQTLVGVGGKGYLLDTRIRVSIFL